MGRFVLAATLLLGSALASADSLKGAEAKHVQRILLDAGATEVETRGIRYVGVSEVLCSHRGGAYCRMRDAIRNGYPLALTGPNAREFIFFVRHLGVSGRRRPTPQGLTDELRLNRFGCQQPRGGSEVRCKAGE